MSWDVWMEIDTGGKKPVEIAECGNMTWNVSPMYYDAFDLENGIRGLDGMSGKNALEHLEKAISKMKRNPEKYNEMNPKNGWGDFAGALLFLEIIMDDCINNPKAIVRVM